MMEVQADEDAVASEDDLDVFKLVFTLSFTSYCTHSLFCYNLHTARAPKSKRVVSKATNIKSAIKYDTEEGEIFSGVEDDSPDEGKDANDRSVVFFYLLIV